MFSGGLLQVDGGGGAAPLCLAAHSPRSILAKMKLEGAQDGMTARKHVARRFAR
ncbi:hypothetical protein [Pseudorhodobacter ferrugineus]|uniref:hypothetical protein n=1 Tax=Pseudorhodobacter ferrugineus TaxID=77008 RepID=UPI0003B3F456|nr:hypothetical protein [Pseudorhodobacter ferrugineus]